ncbi:MAG TPA: hypothetical protein RMF84_05870 [Polyangiaceae bacterium LLY-WYZ-14_1]|nr:hypothetical protein [Polyangiaceae bacterium LLY-WYZ-14_1]
MSDVRSRNDIRRGLVAAVPAAIVLALGGACDDEAPSEQDYDDVAAGLASLVADGDGGGDTGAMVEAAALAQGDVPLGMSSSGEGVFESEHGGLTYRYEVVCFDAAGRQVLSCAGGRADSAEVDVAWMGGVDRPNLKGSVERSGSWTLSGLQSEIARFDGSSTFDVSAEWQSRRGMGHWALAYDATYEGIRVELATLELLDGRARWNVDASRYRSSARREVEASFTITAELSFDDDGDPVLTLDGSRVYDVDPATGDAVRRPDAG